MLLKIKPLTKEQIIISIDRLTRFKDPEVKYLRVFKDIITSNLITPKYKKSELDTKDYNEIKALAEQIINYSISELGIDIKADLSVNESLRCYENSVFSLNKNTDCLLDNKINYSACCSLIGNDAPLNLRWLKELTKKSDIINARKQQDLRFPIEKVVIAEGITEEILLPEFAKFCDYDFDKNGVYIISAGGKNQVVKLFYELSSVLKLPIFVLLDKDAEKNQEEIKPKLRKQDKIHLLNCGEFEDALPVKLVERTLKDSLKNISVEEPFKPDERMTKTLEEVYRHKGLHEFKKAEFAQMVRDHVKSDNDISDEIRQVIEEIKKL